MENSKLPLRFRSDGSFKIMQIADVQDTQKTSRDTIRFLCAALDAQQPDLVVFTGDQIKGYGFHFKGGDVPGKVRQAFANILSPVIERDIPFAVTFGNHDSQVGLSKEEQLKLYQQYTQCVTTNAHGELPGCGNEVLSILSHDGKRTAFRLYMVDSLEYDGDSGDYAYVSSEQIAWCEEECKRSKVQNGGKATPALLFQHIPVPEIYDVLTKATKNTKGAVRGNKGHREYYVLGPELLDGKSFMRENAASPVKNNGQFEGWLRQGDILGAYFGHDHNNCFVGRLKGIDLGYTPGCGFNVYGPGLQRAVRIFELNENDPTNYKTYPVFYKELLGHKVKNPFKCLLYTYAPSSVEAAVPMVLKGAALLGGVAATALLLRGRKK